MMVRSHKEHRTITNSDIRIKPQTKIVLSNIRQLAKVAMACLLGFLIFD
jgi:hypothetical protein